MISRTTGGTKMQIFPLLKVGYDSIFRFGLFFIGEIKAPFTQYVFFWKFIALKKLYQNSRTFQEFSYLPRKNYL